MLFIIEDIKSVYVCSICVLCVLLLLLTQRQVPERYLLMDIKFKVF